MKIIILIVAFVGCIVFSANAQTRSLKQTNDMGNLAILPAKSGFQKFAINVIRYEFHPDIKPALISALKQEFSNCTIEEA